MRLSPEPKNDNKSNEDNLTPIFSMRESHTHVYHSSIWQGVSLIKARRLACQLQPNQLMRHSTSQFTKAIRKIEVHGMLTQFMQDGRKQCGVACSLHSSTHLWHLVTVWLSCPCLSCERNAIKMRLQRLARHAVSLGEHGG
jgi:hypothetical protein